MECGKRGAGYECLLFDMDDTLYPFSSGMNLACRNNIQEYMRDHLHIEEALIPDMCLDLYKEHGTTMAGLKAQGYSFNDDEFHARVHGKLPYDVLKPDPVLRNLLLSMPQRKLIFTNADQIHVERVLHRLGLEDCFHGIICFETLNSAATIAGGDGPPNILCKPALEAMETAVRIANIDPKKTIFFDDSVRNIASGKAIGLNTVIVGRSVLVPGADVALPSIHGIMGALPEIWEEGGERNVESSHNSIMVALPENWEGEELIKVPMLASAASSELETVVVLA